MDAPPATLGAALQPPAEPGSPLDAAFAEDLACALGELARERDRRGPAARGVWITGPRGSGKSTALDRIEAGIGDPAAMRDAPLRAPVEALAALDPVVVRVELATVAPTALVRTLLWSVTDHLGVAPIPPPPSPRALADLITAVCGDLRPSSRLLLLLLDDADAIDREALRPVLVHLLLRGKGRVAVVATGEAPPHDDGGALESCFPEPQRVEFGEGAFLATIQERVLRKTEAARATLGDDALYPIDPAVLPLLVRITSAVERTRREAGKRGEPAPSPIPLLVAMIDRARARPFGARLPIDGAFAILAPWLPAGVAETVARAAPAAPAGSMPLTVSDGQMPLFAAPAEPMPLRIARAVALLSLLQPGTPTTRDLLAIALRDHRNTPVYPGDLDAPIDDLITAGLVTRTTRHGLVLVTPLLAAWAADRAASDVTDEEVSQIVRDELAALLDGVAPPDGPAGPTHLRAVYADGRRAHDEAILDRGGGAPLTLDVRHLPLYRRTREEWLGRSVRGNLLQRLIWIAEGDLPSVQDAGRELGRSRGQLRRAAPTLGRPSRELAWLVDLETARRDDLAAAMRAAVERTFLDGTFYFRGEAMPARALGDRFDTALDAACRAVIPRIFEAPILAPDPPPAPAEEIVVPLPHGREVRSTAELDALLGEIDRRVRGALEGGATRVKLI